MRLGDSPYLRVWLQAYMKGTGESVSRQLLAMRGHTIAEEVKGWVIGRLRACRGVTVGVDRWINDCHDKLLTSVQSVARLPTTGTVWC